MATPYEPPAWAQDGTNVFGVYLDVIRNGVLVETLQLPLDAAKSFVVAGRMEPLCDLVLHHPSLSRVHAVLQFDAAGALYVQDMKSTHGTFVNKKRLAPLQFQRLHVGDMVVFGESTRKYAVCGPEELRPEEPDMAKLRAKIQASKDAQKKRDERENSGATWGFREDAEEEEDDEENSDNDEDKTTAPRRGGDADLPEYLRGLKEHGRSSYESTVKQSDVSDKDQKLFQQLQKKISKMENLETEKARILAKQNDLQGLTEGQQKTLDRNSARIESLAKEIAELEERIHARNAQRDQSRAVNKARDGRGSTGGPSSSMYAYDSDEDDFYDRTSANQQKLRERKQQLEQAARGKTAADTVAKKTTSKGEVLTAEIIQRKIKMLESDLRDLNVEYARVEADRETDRGETEELDALEAFMQSTAKELHAKELARVRTRRDEVETELKKQRQLLAIAMPALQHEQRVATPSKVEQPTRTEERVKLAIPEPTQILSKESVDDKKRVNTPPRESQHTTQAQRSHEEKEVPVHEAKEQSAAEAGPAPPKKKRRVMGPTLPPPTATPATTTDSAVLEGGERVWVPPANQTGDGRTKLNDKYGY